MSLRTRERSLLVNHRHAQGADTRPAMASRVHDAGSGTAVGAKVASKSSYQMKPWKKAASFPVMTMRPSGVSECQPFQVQSCASLGMVAVRLSISEPERS